MKKFVTFALVVLVAVLALAPNVAVAEAPDGVSARSAQDGEIYSFVEELCELNNKGDGFVREYLLDKFTEALDGKGTVSRQQFSYGQASYVNLVAKLTKSQSAEQVIIGAHYDSVFEGAGDNACGVAALYLTMVQLAAKFDKQPYNLTFVAFDGEEGGLLGSQYYVETMSQGEIDSTRAMFNFDTIATGDNLYVHCENKSTDLAKLIVGSVQGLQEKPYAKGIFSNLYDVYGYGYYERIQGSDHTPFRLKGIPTALFFSGTYSIWGYAENSDSSKSVMNTASDTFENLVTKHSDFTQRIVTVSDAVVATVSSEKFATIDARAQLVNLGFWYNSLWPIIVVAVIAIALTVCAILYYRKLQKNAILGTPEIKSQTVFNKPSAEDIFTFNQSDEGDGVDDVFTFKK